MPSKGATSPITVYVDQETERVELRQTVNQLSGELDDLRAVSAETIGQTVGVLNEMGAQVRLGSAEERADASRTQLGQSLAVLSDQLAKLSGIHMDTRRAVSKLDVSVGKALPEMEARSNHLEERIGAINAALGQVSDQLAGDLGALGDA